MHEGLSGLPGQGTLESVGRERFLVLHEGSQQVVVVLREYLEQVARLPTEARSVWLYATRSSDWSEADLRRFASLLGRFTQAYEATARNWIDDRIAARSGRGRGTT